jgi:D-proline reductase (dithiol) PrdB
MQPVRYVDLLNEKYHRQGFPPYRWTIHDDAPFTALNKPLSECRVSMLTSGGVSLCSMPSWDAFARNDFRLDEIEADRTSDDFQVHDSYYETESARRDVNCVFPIERLRELADSGTIQSVGKHYSGFMGRIYKRTHVMEVAAPELARALIVDQIDLFLLVPS